MNKWNAYKESYDALSYTAAQKTRIAKQAVAEVNSLQPKSRRSFFLLSKIAAVAACLVSVLTISAEAAGIPTPVSEILAPIFGGAVAQTEVMDKIGCPIDASDTDNGVTIRADAIIGDQYNVCILFSISRDDGTPLLPDNITAEQLHAGGVSDIRLIRSGGAHGGAWFRDDTPGDSTIEYVYFISSDEPLNKGTAKAEFENLSYFDETAGKEIVVVEGHWKFRFDVDYEDSSVPFGEGAIFEQDGMHFTITGANISPVGIRVSYEVDSQIQWSSAPSGRLPDEDRSQMERYLENVEILLIQKDGSIIDVSNSGGTISLKDGKTYCTKSRIFDEIISLEELESVSVGGIRFPIS